LSGTGSFDRPQQNRPVSAYVPLGDLRRNTGPMPTLATAGRGGGGGVDEDGDVEDVKTLVEAQAAELKALKAAHQRLQEDNQVPFFCT